MCQLSEQLHNFYKVWGEACQIIAYAQELPNPFYILQWGHVINDVDPIWMWGDAVTAKEIAHPGNLVHSELKLVTI